MFAQLSYSATLLEPTLIPVTQDVFLGRPIDEESPGLCFVVSVSGRTVGTLTLQAYGSVDGSTYYSLGSTMATAVPTNGLYYVNLQGAVPPNVGLRLTPAGGFDGAVGVVVRSGGQIDTSLPGQG